MAKKGAKLPMFVRRHRLTLVPAGAFDAERLAALPIGQDIEITVSHRRSHPQERLYWAALTNVCRATEAYPTAMKLHKALKRALGYVVTERQLDGREIEELDSTAFEAMSQDEFKVYFDQAMQKLGETFGVDPLALQREVA
jgi:hypothetical protein